MVYPVLAHKHNGDESLYGFKDSHKIKRTSKELLKAGIFDNVFLIDSTGMHFKIDNVRETGWAGSFWGLSLVRKGRQILVDFDLIPISRDTLETIKNFVLEKLNKQYNKTLIDEISKSAKEAKSIEEIINLFI